ncbi:MAG TPA: hypothetical protein VF406_16120, partial [Thermodesulfobacteriota bacterium]
PSAVFSAARMERQVRFATAVALTRTAYRAQEQAKLEMQRIFDRPTPFTLNALRVTPARKDRLVAEVGFREFAGKGTPATKYLLPQATGGARPVKRFEKRLQFAGLLPRGQVLVPGGGAPLDAFGNVQRRVYSQILSQLKAQADERQHETARSRRRHLRRRGPRFVWMNPGNRGWGVWQRIDFAVGSAVKPIFLAVDKARYAARFPFQAIVLRVARQAYAPEFARALRDALRTAR